MLRGGGGGGGAVHGHLCRRLAPVIKSNCTSCKSINELWYCQCWHRYGCLIDMRNQGVVQFGTPGKKNCWGIFLMAIDVGYPVHCGQCHPYAGVSELSKKGS